MIRHPATPAETDEAMITALLAVGGGVGRGVGEREEEREGGGGQEEGGGHRGGERLCEGDGEGRGRGRLGEGDGEGEGLQMSEEILSTGSTGTWRS